MWKNSTSSWGGRRKLPYAFTEQGIYMLMTIETKNLNKAMNGNKNRFPEEFKNQRCQNGTFKQVTSERKYCPYLYTEHGVIALVGILKSGTKMPFFRNRL